MLTDPESLSLSDAEIIAAKKCAKDGGYGCLLHYSKTFRTEPRVYQTIEATKALSSADDAQKYLEDILEGYRMQKIPATVGKVAVYNL